LLPNFLIVGAAKAGTTAIYEYLRQHPEVFLPGELKESFFFAGVTPERFPGPGGRYAEGAVRSLTDYERLFDAAGGRKAIGEACVAYLYFHETSIPRIRAVLGDSVRIVIVLRDPAERAFSNYLHHVRDGYERLSFEDALAAEEERRAKGWWWGFQYRDVSRYAGQVRAYLDAFGRERVTVALYEDLSRDPSGFLRGLFEALGVDPRFAPDTSIRHNPSGVPRSALARFVTVQRHGPLGSLRRLVPAPLRRRAAARLQDSLTSNLVKPPLSPALRRALVAELRDDVLALSGLLERDLSAWLSDASEVRVG
jgi:hypothetical protein